MSGMHRNRIEKKMHKRRISFQRVVQLVSAVVLNGYVMGFAKGGIFTGASKAVCIPVLNCYSCPGALGACPIGALQTALGTRHHFPFYVLGFLMLIGIVSGRLVCGLCCPFGLVQDLIHKIPTPKWVVPKSFDRAARMLKYVMLFVVVVLLSVFAAAGTGIAPPYFCKYICPAGTLGGGIPLIAANPALRELLGVLFDWKVLVLAVILAACLFIHRPFCRYLCPLGAFYSLFNRFSFYQMYLDREKCTGCKECERLCPMAVELTKDINSLECIRCGKCKSSCPAQAISWGFSETLDKRKNAKNTNHALHKNE